MIIKQYTFFGILTAIFAGLLPFISTRQLFYGQINSKYFFVMVFVSILSVYAGYCFFTGKKIFGLRKRLFFIFLLFTLFLYYLASFLGIGPLKSLWSDILRSTGLLFITHIILFSFIIGEFFKEKDWAILRRTVAISSGIFALLSILAAEGVGLTGKFLWINLSENGLTFGNGTFAGSYLLLALGLTFIEISRTTQKIFKRILIASACLIMISPYFLNIKLLFFRT